MSYTLFLVRVPAGASDEEVETIALAANEAEIARGPSPPDPEAERRKRALADALLAEFPELDGGEPNYAELARANDITEDEARQRFPWGRVAGPEDGAGMEITLYDTFVTLDMAAGGTDEDWEDVWRYLEVLVREGGFVIWDPQAPNVVDLSAGPSGDGTRMPRPKPATRRKRTGGRPSAKRSATRGGTATADDTDEGADRTEPEDVRRGGELAKLVNRVVDEAIAARLAAAGFRRSGRTWRRYLDDGVVQVVNVQWSPGHEGEAGFTLNAGVYFPALATSIADFPVTATPKEYDCHVRKRPLIPGVSGWRVRVPGVAKPDPDLGDGFVRAFFAWLDRRADQKAPKQRERATREMRESLERYTLPWLEQVSTLRGARDELLKRGPVLWGLHASIILGERDEAARILERELQRADPVYAETLRAWGRANGLLP
ncbi:MAG TPA: DUF4304 domain-containing protein [Gemmatimonadaceae bacterium]|nr:DUF4304 domain-containing protein [Gemmatimonadaceae bacterium]